MAPGGARCRLPWFRAGVCRGGTVPVSWRRPLTPFKDQSGNVATVQGTAAQAAFQSARMELASSKGTRWSDPDLRRWEGDNGTIHAVNWGG
jgi:hypothetical protein